MNLDICLQQLKKIHKNGEQITINGKTGYGDFFETSGVIASDKNGDMAVQRIPYFQDRKLVYSNEDILEVSQKTPFGNFTIAFKTNILHKNSVLISENDLYIYEIKDEDGTIIYKNSINAIANIEQEVKNCRKKYRNEEKIKGCNIVIEDQVTAALRDYIAKPIVIDDHCGILLKIAGCADNGHTLIYVIKWDYNSQYQIKTNSVLKDLKGNVIAQNDPLVTRKIFDYRVNKMKKNQDEQIKN